MKMEERKNGEKREVEENESERMKNKKRRRGMKKGKR
jgi:hypothetical protein